MHTGPNGDDDEVQAPESTLGTPPGIPRWVKIFGITALGLVLLVVVGLLVATSLGLHDPSFGHGGHGPGPAPTAEVQPL